ncbi:hypothetical protein V2J09_009417 [Rumex salicifolius]
MDTLLENLAIRATLEGLRRMVLAYWNGQGWILRPMRWSMKRWRITSIGKIIANNCILSISERVRRHLGSDSGCLVCHEGEEDTMHILRNCNEAKKVWCSLIGGNNWRHFAALDRMEWLKSNLDKPGEWPTTFAMGLWWI